MSRGWMPPSSPRAMKPPFPSGCRTTDSLRVDPFGVGSPSTWPNNGTSSRSAISGPPALLTQKTRTATFPFARCVSVSRRMSLSIRISNPTTPRSLMVANCGSSSSRSKVSTECSPTTEDVRGTACVRSRRPADVTKVGKALPGLENLLGSDERHWWVTEFNDLANHRRPSDLVLRPSLSSVPVRTSVYPVVFIPYELFLTLAVVAACWWRRRTRLRRQAGASGRKGGKGANGRRKPPLDQPA